MTYTEVGHEKVTGFGFYMIYGSDQQDIYGMFL